jgi:tRNA-splicing ligase RtcB (3'-phosphate/5'-hydroxy nucleic acid ligase)
MRVSSSTSETAVDLTTTMKVRPVDDCIWEIGREEKAGMLVPARIYASGAWLAGMDPGVFEQVTNVACLPGIVGGVACAAEAPPRPIGNIKG